MAKLKRVTVSAFLPELPAGHAYQECHGSGSSLSVAIGRSVDELLKLPLVKGRRLTSLKLTVAVIQ
jgi:hypothetical protein